MRRLGPELKMPDLKKLKGMRPKKPSTPSGVKKAKLPPAVDNVYKDLRDRHLLPLVVLVLVAIVAVPFLLGSDAEQPAPSPGPAAAGAGDGAAVGKASTLRVAEARPGLRDYEKRLDNRTSTNPFKQRYTSLPPSAELVETGGGGESEGGGGGGEATEIPADTGGTTPADSGGSPGDGGGDGRPRLFEFVVNVQISRSELGPDGEYRQVSESSRRKVRPLTQLPGAKAPALTTMGVDLNNGKVMFLVGDEARSLEGEFNCLTRGEGVCELLEVEPGLLLDVFYGPNRVRYSFKATAIDVVPARKSRAAGASRATLEEIDRNALKFP